MPESAGAAPPVVVVRTDPAERLREVLSYLSHSYKGRFRGTVVFEIPASEVNAHTVFYVRCVPGRAGVETAYGYPPDKAYDAWARMSRDDFFFLYKGGYTAADVASMVLCGRIRTGRVWQLYTLQNFAMDFDTSHACWIAFYRKEGKLEDVERLMQEMWVRARKESSGGEAVLVDDSGALVPAGGLPAEEAARLQARGRHYLEPAAGPGAAAEPAEVEPAAAGLEAVEPAVAGQEAAEPAAAEPTAGEPAALEPAALEPAALEAVEPAAVEPAAAEAAGVEPVVAEAAPAEPSPAPVEQGSSDAVLAEPDVKGACPTSEAAVEAEAVAVPVTVQLEEPEAVEPGAAAEPVPAEPTPHTLLDASARAAEDAAAEAAPALEPQPLATELSPSAEPAAVMKEGGQAAANAEGEGEEPALSLQAREEVGQQQREGAPVAGVDVGVQAGGDDVVEPVACVSAQALATAAEPDSPHSDAPTSTPPARDEEAAAAAAPPPSLHTDAAALETPSPSLQAPSTPPLHASSASPSSSEDEWPWGEDVQEDGDDLAEDKALALLLPQLLELPLPLPHTLLPPVHSAGARFPTLTVSTFLASLDAREGVENAGGAEASAPLHATDAHAASLAECHATFCAALEACTALLHTASELRGEIEGLQPPPPAPTPALHPTPPPSASILSSFLSSAADLTASSAAGLREYFVDTPRRAAALAVAQGKLAQLQASAIPAAAQGAANALRSLHCAAEGAAVAAAPPLLASALGAMVFPGPRLGSALHAHTLQMALQGCMVASAGSGGGAAPSLPLLLHARNAHLARLLPSVEGGASSPLASSAPAAALPLDAGSCTHATSAAQLYPPLWLRLAGVQAHARDILAPGPSATHGTTLLQHALLPCVGARECAETLCALQGLLSCQQGGGEEEGEGAALRLGLWGGSLMHRPLTAAHMLGAAVPKALSEEVLALLQKTRHAESEAVAAAPAATRVPAGAQGMDTQAQAQDDSLVTRFTGLLSPLTSILSATGSGAGMQPPPVVSPPPSSPSFTSAPPASHPIHASVAWYTASSRHLPLLHPLHALPNYCARSRAALEGLLWTPMLLPFFPPAPAPASSSPSSHSSHSAHPTLSACSALVLSAWARRGGHCLDPCAGETLLYCLGGPLAPFARCSPVTLGAVQVGVGSATAAGGAAAGASTSPAADTSLPFLSSIYTTLLPLWRQRRLLVHPLQPQGSATGAPHTPPDVYNSYGSGLFLSTARARLEYVERQESRAGRAGGGRSRGGGAGYSLGGAGGGSGSDSSSGGNTSDPVGSTPGKLRAMLGLFVERGSNILRVYARAPTLSIYTADFDESGEVAGVGGGGRGRV